MFSNFRFFFVSPIQRPQLQLSPLRPDRPLLPLRPPVRPRGKQAEVRLQAGRGRRKRHRRAGELGGALVLCRKRVFCIPISMSKNGLVGDRGVLLCRQRFCTTLSNLLEHFGEHCVDTFFMSKNGLYFFLQYFGEECVEEEDEDGSEGDSVDMAGALLGLRCNGEFSTNIIHTFFFFEKQLHAWNIFRRLHLGERGRGRGLPLLRIIFLVQFQLLVLSKLVLPQALHLLRRHRRLQEQEAKGVPQEVRKRTCFVDTH